MVQRARPSQLTGTVGSKRRSAIRIARRGDPSRRPPSPRRAGGEPGRHRGTTAACDSGRSLLTGAGRHYLVHLPHDVTKPYVEAETSSGVALLALGDAGVGVPIVADLISQIRQENVATNAPGPGRACAYDGDAPGACEQAVERARPGVHGPRGSSTTAPSRCTAAVVVGVQEPVSLPRAGCTRAQLVWKFGRWRPRYPT